MRQWYAPKIVAQILQQRETYDRPTLPVYGPQHVRADSGLALPRERHRQLARTLPRPSTEAAFLPGVASMPCYPSSSCAPQGVARSQTVRQGVFANMSRWFARQVPRHVFAGGLMKVQERPAMPPKTRLTLDAPRSLPTSRWDCQMWLPQDAANDSLSPCEDRITERPGMLLPAMPSGRG